jgi:hypothetical protein
MIVDCCFVLLSLVFGVIVIGIIVIVIVIVVVAVVIVVDVVIISLPQPSRQDPLLLCMDDCCV